MRFKFKSAFSFGNKNEPYELSEEEKLRHANSNTYKKLCEQVDNIAKRKNYNNDDLDGWTVKKSSYDPKSNFKGVLYEKDGQYALAFAGTERPSLKSLGGWKDWGANLKMGLTGDNKQNQLANDFAEKMIKENGLTPENVVALGHSEGGFEATNVGLNNGLKTYTFNGFGVHKSKLPENVDLDLVTNYRHPHDPVSKIHANVGKTYIIPNTQNWFMSKTPFGALPSHRIDAIGDCNTSIPVDKYKSRDRFFIDKLSDAEITREDIGQMDNVLFALYEPEIDRRLKNNEIYTAAQLASRGNKYINGYTRGGYYRRG